MMNREVIKLAREYHTAIEDDDSRGQSIQERANLIGFVLIYVASRLGRESYVEIRERLAKTA